jgi:hypothetical protein
VPHTTAVSKTPPESDWDTAHHVWALFVRRHPELRYPEGRWGFHNFNRAFRRGLLAADAIRLARNKFWVAHRERFPLVAFDLATSYANRSENSRVILSPEETTR